MSAPWARADRKWYSLALRHLRMARRLLRSGFADGAAFHGYHCYECLLSALIAAKGYPVPPEGWTRLELPSGRVIEAYPSPAGSIQERNAHKARIVFFDELADPGRRYFALHRLLRTFLTYQDRLRGWSLRVGPRCRIVGATPASPGRPQADSRRTRRRLWPSGPRATPASPLRTGIPLQDSRTAHLDALYYDPGTDRLPQDRYSAAYADGLLSTLWQFAREVRSEIP
jgi:hypothetical protein